MQAFLGELEFRPSRNTSSPKDAEGRGKKLSRVGKGIPDVHLLFRLAQN